MAEGSRKIQLEFGQTAAGCQHCCTGTGTSGGGENDRSKPAFGGGYKRAGQPAQQLVHVLLAVPLQPGEGPDHRRGVGQERVDLHVHALEAQRLVELELLGHGVRVHAWRAAAHAEVVIARQVPAALRPRAGQFVVGFAAEFGLEGLGRARDKMERKHLDMIVFNDISRGDIGFDSDFNEVRILTRDSEVLIERAPKETIAELILDNIAQTVRGRQGELSLIHI